MLSSLDVPDTPEESGPSPSPMTIPNAAPPTGFAPPSGLPQRPPMIGGGGDDDDDDDDDDDNDPDFEIDPDDENDNEVRNESSDPEEGGDEEEDEDLIEEDTTLYYIGDQAILDPDHLSETIKFFTTLAQCEREVLERWKHYTVLMYNVKEDFKADSVEPVEEEDWLYKELPMPDDPEIVIISKDNFDKLTQTEVLPLLREYVAIRTNISKRRFARLDKGTMLYSANGMAITDPKPKDGEPGCFFYTTLALPQEAVLQAWADKVLNSYYVNRNMVLPYGAHADRDEYFDDKYTDVIKDEEEDEEKVITSYYDDTIEGEYVDKDEGSAEVFLVEKDLDSITYFGSQDMKLQTVKFINGVEHQKDSI